MLLISKAVSQLLLPPGIFILLGMIVLVFWKKQWARTLFIGTLAFMWALSTEPVRDYLTHPLEFQYSAFRVNTHPNSKAAIVLLGGGIRENAPDFYGSDMLSKTSMVRTMYAATIAKQTNLNIYATGGTPLTQTAKTEADMMKTWLVWLGIDVSRIISENKANTTWENAVFTQKLLNDKDINTIILVTSAWHMPRAAWCFEQQGLKVTPAPTDYLTSLSSYDLRSYLPHWRVLADSGKALHEYLGLMWYKLRYTS